METEYERLFGSEGVYTSAKAHSRLNVMPPLSQYAVLVKELHDAGITVRATGNKDSQGMVNPKFIIS